ncbi:MAG: DNA replication/repair protein RecF [Patescibacteria group bacterium]
MRLRSLSLTQFRSYTECNLPWDNVLHLLLGSNGSGKTNILEAISILSLGRSCLGSEEEDLPRWGTEFYRLRAETVSDAGEKETLEIVSQLLPRKAKAAFVNDVKVPVSSIVGHLPTVTFLPSDLNLFGGPPSERRRFLDQILCQVSPEYSEAHSAYQKTVKQRNALLRRIAEDEASAGELETWDTAVSEKGSLLTIRRLELIETFGLALREELAALGENGSDVRFVYDRKGGETLQERLAEELLSMLRRHRERDILLQATSIGPHRDDWHIAVEGRDLRSFASRGQQRTAVLALLFLEVSYLEIRRGEKPVVLLDDVFSELDDEHQDGVLASLKDHQVIITATHQPEKLHGAEVRVVDKGTIRK